ncbi:MAG: LUD domain-containing protein [Bacteroidales bacterium]|nr:LUD domain-containing protein [Bacteroidales bacterium]
MGSREKILSRIKKGVAPAVALPDMSIADKWNSEVDIDALKLVLEAVGGEMHILDSVADVDEKLSELFPDVKMAYTNVEGVEFGNVDLDVVKSAHELAKLEIAVLQGEFAVEENGSVFVRDNKMGNKMIPTITEYLVLVVSKNEIVKNMHEAYKRFDLGKMEYGVFISGPSKTADIESTLVFGAHGAKNLALLLV